MGQVDFSFFPRGAVLCVLVLAAGSPSRAAEDNAPVSVQVVSSLQGEKGLGRILSSASEGNTAETAREVEKGLLAYRWLRVVPSEAEALVAVERRSRSEYGRTKDKQGRESIKHRYTAVGTVAIAGDRRTVEAETTYNQGPDDYRDDARQFQGLAAEMAAKVAGHVLDRLDELRPDRPYHGFVHQPKYRMLFRGDGLEIMDVEAGSPAEQAGLQVKDRIRRIGQEKGTDQMHARVWEWWIERPGTRVAMEVERNKERRTVELTLLPRSQWAGEAEPVRRATARAATPATARAAIPAPARAAIPATSGLKATAAATSRPAAAPATVQIEKGMTEAEVTRALGEPRKRVAFGSRSVWTYDGFSVTFVGGKVTDVN